MVALGSRRTSVGGGVRSNRPEPAAGERDGGPTGNGEQRAFPGARGSLGDEECRGDDGQRDAGAGKLEEGADAERHGRRRGRRNRSRGASDGADGGGDA